MSSSCNDSKEMYKTACRLVFFFAFLVASPSSLLKLPMEILEKQNCLPRGLPLIAYNNTFLLQKLTTVHFCPVLCMYIRTSDLLNLKIKISFLGIFSLRVQARKTQKTSNSTYRQIRNGNESVTYSIWKILRLVKVEVNRHKTLPRVPRDSSHP